MYYLLKKNICIICYIPDICIDFTKAENLFIYMIKHFDIINNLGKKKRKKRKKKK
jgi:hypothetical protein